MLRILLMIFWAVAITFIVLALIVAGNALLIGVGYSGLLSESSEGFLIETLFYFALALFSLVLIIKCKYCGKRQFLCISNDTEKSVAKETNWWGGPAIVLGKKRMRCCRCNEEL